MGLQEERLNIIKNTDNIENALNNALIYQDDAEKDYKKELEKLINIQNQELTEAEKNYIISFKLDINSKIAGISGFDSSFLNNTVEDKNKIKEQLIKEKEKRYNFNNQIITELINATSNINNKSGT